MVWLSEIQGKKVVQRLVYMLWLNSTRFAMWILVSHRDGWEQQHGLRLPINKEFRVLWIRVLWITMICLGHRNQMHLDGCWTKVGNVKYDHSLVHLFCYNLHIIPHPLKQVLQVTTRNWVDIHLHRADFCNENYQISLMKVSANCLVCIASAQTSNSYLLKGNLCWLCII